jgi:hypothetical protein
MFYSSYTIASVERGAGRCHGVCMKTYPSEAGGVSFSRERERERRERERERERERDR